MSSKCPLLLLLLVRCVEIWAAEPPLVEARIKLISMNRPLVGVGILQGKKTEGIVIPTDMFSDEIDYRGPARFQLIETTVVEQPAETSPVTAEDKEPGEAKTPVRGVRNRPRNVQFAPTGRPPLAWTDLPTGSGRLHLILLVTPGKGNGITVINDQPGSFPPGSNRYVNLCDFPVTVRVPSDDYPLPAKGEKIARPGAANQGYYDLKMLTKPDGADVLAFSGRVFHMESIRKLYLIMPAPGGNGRLIVRDIEDRPAPPKGQGLSPSGPKAAR